METQCLLQEKNIDPRAKRYDMSNDVVTYTADRFIVIDNKIAELNEILL
ncbi:MAG: hypothetical protein Ct9H90mP19_0280 [Gammaproteobacteria bacterium]|nr:MAG: hypothetical protein Ct9H90mP19_0280 [Gammaproteobacteria bacterium]